MQYPKTLSSLEEFEKFERKIKKEIEEEIKKLKTDGFTDDDLRILFEGLEHIAHPVVAEYFENESVYKNYKH
ncbi:MAG TPA: hypothetical protein PK431_03075 [Chitinophagales bacterium]|nr:hypothetical protein [Chitinophagales bacterium]